MNWLNPLEWIGSLNKLLELVDKLLGSVGIEIPRLWLQILLFLLLLILLVGVLVPWARAYVRRQGLKNRVVAGTAFTSCCVALFLIGAILWHWISPADDSVDVAAREQLSGIRSTTGQTVFLLPYELEGFRPDLLENDLLRGVIVYLQERGVRREYQHIGLRRLEKTDLPKNYSATDVEMVGKMGSILNALAMVQINGKMTVQHEQKVLSLESRYLIVPSARDFIPRVLFIDDMAPTSVPLYQNISHRWGHGTILAIAIKEYVRAKNEDNRELLRTVRSYLIAERSTLSAKDKGLADDITALIALCDQGLNS